MNDDFDQLHQALEEWAASTCAAGWLQQRDVDALEQIERQQAERLFVEQGQRPLIVALFGGTGVGKSSLLNRLAGAEIRRIVAFVAAHAAPPISA